MKIRKNIIWCVTWIVLLLQLDILGGIIPFFSDSLEWKIEMLLILFDSIFTVLTLSKNGTLSDTLSTTLFVMGKDKAISYWKKHSSEFNIILVDNNDKILISQGIEERFSSENEYQVVKK